MDDEALSVFRLLQMLMQSGDEAQVVDGRMNASCRLLDDGGCGLHLEVPGASYTEEADNKRQAIGSVWWQYCQDKLITH